jgi:Tol biopolymer transport system component
LTAGPLSFRDPVLSPDGSRVFASGVEDRGGNELVRYDFGHSGFVPYLGGIPAHSVTFSTDGQWAAYVKIRENTLWRIRADGTDAKQLTFPPTDVAGVAWSPNGNEMALRAKFPGKPSKIYLISSQGGEPRELLPQHREEEGIPTWSRDGKQIVFGDVPAEFRQATGGEAIHVCDLETHNLSSLPGSKGLWTPRWSPDGRYIAALTIANQELMIFDSRSETWRSLKVDHVNSPTWSRDRKYIYFDLLDGTGNGIFRVRVSDGKYEQVASFNGIRRDVSSWSGLSPDDSPLVVRHIGQAEIYALDVQWP